MYLVTFDAGARTHWHTHPLGQGLFVTDGVAIVQTEGELPLRVRTGESLWIDAGRRHWHGAGTDGPMTHLAYQESTKDLATVEWHEAVTATSYHHSLEAKR